MIYNKHSGDDIKVFVYPEKENIRKTVYDKKERQDSKRILNYVWYELFLVKVVFRRLHYY